MFSILWEHQIRSGKSTVRGYLNGAAYAQAEFLNSQFSHRTVKPFRFLKLGLPSSQQIFCIRSRLLRAFLNCVGRLGLLSQSSQLKFFKLLTVTSFAARGEMPLLETRVEHSNVKKGIAMCMAE